MDIGDLVSGKPSASRADTGGSIPSSPAIDWDNVQRMVDQKYISVQKHPTEDLYIYNYTQKAQFDNVWNNETLQCRGLIADAGKKIIARPFRKFFNLQEAIDKGEQIPLEEFTVQDKFDGSLGILYWIGEKPFLATRGSFTSDQAKVGTELLWGDRNWFEDLKKEYTYLFEIIYPENRIVVDYKGLRQTVLLAVINTVTGEELDIYDECAGFAFAGHKEDIKDYKTLPTKENAEGYVIRFKNGQRYKVKFDEYVRLHRLVTGVNARRIWDMLRNNQPMDELLERVPDEFFSWVKKTRDNMVGEFKITEHVCKIAVDVVKRLPTRKEQADYIVTQGKYAGIMFRMLDGKDYADGIWKLLRPKHEVPFKVDLDA